MKLLTVILLITGISNAGIRVTIGGNLTDGQYAFYFDKEKDSTGVILQRVEAKSMRLQKLKVTNFLYTNKNNGEKMVVADLKVAEIDLLKFASSEGKALDYPNAIYVPFYPYIPLNIADSKIDSYKGKIGYISIIGSEIIHLKVTGKDIDALNPLFSSAGPDDDVSLTINSSADPQSERVSIYTQRK